MTTRLSSAADSISLPAVGRQDSGTGQPAALNVHAAAPAVEDERRPAGATVEAEYALETPVRCSACGERVAMLKAVRLIRARVNFTSTLPRRGRVVVCPHCFAIVPAELTNF